MRPGHKPLLTEAQRAEVAANMKLRRELRTKLRALDGQVTDAKCRREQLRAELRALPTQEKQAETYGVCKDTIAHAERTYLNLNPLDAKRAEQCATPAS